MGTAGRPREIGSMSDRTEEMIGPAISPKWLWGPHNILFNQYLRPIFPWGKWSRHEADHSPALAPNLRMSGAVPPLRHMRLWHVQWQLYFSYRPGWSVSVSSPLQTSKSRLLIFLYLLTQFVSVLPFGTVRNCEIAFKKFVIQSKVGVVFDTYGPKLSLNHNF